MIKDDSAHNKKIRYLVAHGKASRLLHYKNVDAAIEDAGLNNCKENEKC